MTTFLRNGFEAGTFTGLGTGEIGVWSGTYASPTIQSAIVHHGLYAGRFVMPEGGYQHCDCYFTVPYGITSLYARAQAYFVANSIPIGTYHFAVWFEGANSSNNIVALGVYNNGGTLQWVLLYLTSAGAQIQTITTPTPQYDTPYELKIYCKMDSALGVATGWINNIQVFNFTNLINNGEGRIASIRVGQMQTGYAGGNGATIIDCVEVADTDIPSETVNPRTLTLVQSSNGTISSANTIYESGTTATVTATPANGYQVSDWLVGDSATTMVPQGLTSTSISVLMDVDKWVQAVFTAIPVVLAVTVSPQNVTLIANQSQTFTATVTGGTGTPTIEWYNDSNILLYTGNPFSTSWSSVGTYVIYAKATDGTQTATSLNVTIHVFVASSKLFGLNIQLGGGQGLTRTEMQRIRAWGFNTIRLPLYFGQIMPTDEFTVNQNVFTTSLGPSGTVGMDSYVQWAAEEGLNIILDMAWTETWAPPAWAFIGLTNDYARYEQMFTSGSREGVAYKNAWKAISARYPNAGHLMMELVNEPGINDANSVYPDYYRAFMESVIDNMQSVETVSHVKIVPMLRWGTGWDEVVDQQTKVNRANVYWSTHRYEPMSGYDPVAQVYGWYYVNPDNPTELPVQGWCTHDQYIYGRIRRVHTKIASWGQQEINTEFGKNISETYYQEWLNLVMNTHDAVGLNGWVYNDYNRTQVDEMSVIDTSGAERTAILSVLQAHMTAATANRLTINCNLPNVEFTVDGSIKVPAGGFVDLTNILHTVEAPPSVSTGSGLLHTSGTELYNSNNNPFRLYTISTHTGQGWRITQQDIADIKAWGFTGIRFHITWGGPSGVGGCQPSPTTMNETAFTTGTGQAGNNAVDDIVNWCRDAGLYVILCQGWSGYWQAPTWAQSATGLTSWGDDGATKQHIDLLNNTPAQQGALFYYGWLANRYKDYWNVVFEAFNELASDPLSSVDQQKWAEYNNLWISAIEANEGSISHIKVLEMLYDNSYNGGINYNNTLPILNGIHNNVVLACHTYTLAQSPLTEVQRIGNAWRAFADSENRPLTCTEGSNALGGSLAQWASEIARLNLVGFGYFTHSGSADSQFYNVGYSGSRTAILNVLQPYMAPYSGGASGGTTYAFNRWQEDSDTNPNKQIYLTAPATLTAIYGEYVPPTATLSGFVLDSFSNPIAGATVTADSTSVVTDANGGYVFSGLPPAIYTILASKTGYVANSIQVDASAGGTFTNNITLQTVTYQLTVEPTTGGTTNPATGTYTYPAGTIVDVSVATTQSGWVFDHWMQDGVNIGNRPITIAMDANHTIQAVFLLQQFTLTVLISVGGTTTPATGSYPYTIGTVVPISATPSSVDYVFTKWLLDSVDYVGNTVTMNANHTLQAVFTLIPALVAEAGGPYSAHITAPTIQFNGNVTGGVAPYSWSWDFGDGATSNAQSPIHTYPAGTYTATLTVTDNRGISAFDTATVTITPLAPPVAQFTWNPTLPVVGETVTLDGSNSYVQETGTVIIRYDWRFGDGATETTVVPTTTHVYATANVFPVVLTVTDTAGTSNSITHNIEVGQPPHLLDLAIVGNGNIFTYPASTNGWYPYGTSVDIIPTATTGNYLESLTDNGVSIIPPPAKYTVIMDVDHQVTVTFASIPPQQWSINITVNHASGGYTMPSGTQLIASGVGITVDAVANSGYTFVKWVLNSVDSGTDPRIIIPPQSAGASFTLSAEFIQTPIQAGFPLWIIPVGAVGAIGFVFALKGNKHNNKKR